MLAEALRMLALVIITSAICKGLEDNCRVQYKMLVVIVRILPDLYTWNLTTVMQMFESHENVSVTVRTKTEAAID